LRGTADRLITAADAGRWWQVEYVAQSTLSTRRDWIVETVQKMQELMTERQAKAKAAGAAAQRTIAVTTVGLSLLMVITILVTIVVTLRGLARPVESLAEAAGRLAAGNLAERVEPGRVKEFAYLANAFNEMAARLQASYTQLEQQVVELKQETAERERAQAESMRLQQEVIETQKQTLRELSTPIIPVMERILVMPLVGNVDSARARDITRTLLAGIREYRARVVIVDITGVSIVDSDVANYLNKTIQAARLKGARTIITGISDAVAETIVDLGIEWDSSDTLSDLQTGLVVALDSLGLELAETGRR
jgi:anti-anti-sigma regulatory factor/HAMP domain-containing protein